MIANCTPVLRVSVVSRPNNMDLYSYESKEGHTCESLPHDDYGCPLEPQDYDNCGLEKCALGQPVGGETWIGRSNCDCTTRRMSIKDVEL